MTARHRTTIRRRLLRFALAVSILTLTVAGVLFSVNDIQMLRRQMLRDLEVLAAVVGDSCLGALSFDAPETAEKNLANLRREHQIRQAVLFDAEGRPFADFRRDADTDAETPAWPGDGVALDVSLLGLGTVTVARDLDLSGQRLGGILIQATTDELALQMRRYLLMAALLLSATLAVTLPLALRLQQRISAPIRLLAAKTREISAHGDYRLRLPDPETGDELATLYLDFNAMLGQIEHRDQALRNIREHLEQLVDDRTQRLDDLLHELGLILEALPLGVVHLVGRRVARVNPRAEELFGWTSDEIVGRETDRFYARAEDFNEVGEIGYRMMAHGGIYRTDRVLRRKDGRSFWGRLIGQAIDQTRPDRGSLWIVDDIDRDKTLEAGLHQAREAAEAANRAKDAFMANMSHELRTPLGSVLGFAQILELDPSLDRRQREQVAGIRRGGERLLGLIGDLLDLARIESGHLELEPVEWDTAALLRELADTFAGRAVRKGIGLRIEPSGGLPRRLVCDAKRLHQVLANLIDNAIKYTDDGEVRVRAGFGEEDLLLEVEDTGPGIIAGEIARVFEPFHQTGDGTTAAGGVGLGLAIARQLVEHMGGSISVDSMLGAGTRFLVRVPAQRPARDETAPVPTPRLAGVVGYRRRLGAGPLRILIADDEEANREVLDGMLAPLGFSIGKVANGRDCVERCIDWRPDLILMDLRMPVMDGLDATRTIRQSEAAHEIPVVAVTAAAFESDRVACLSAGCDAHLAKPVLREDLLETLGALLPLDWVRAGEGTEAPGTGTSALPEDLPPADRERLLRLVRQGDVTAIGRLGRALAGRDCCPMLAHRLARLADGFDIAGLRRLISELPGDTQSEGRSAAPSGRERTPGPGGRRRQKLTEK